MSSHKKIVFVTETILASLVLWPICKFPQASYTVEFQKCGLPHAHILLWLQSSARFKTPADIDRVVSAEIPNKELDPSAYEAVTSMMMHGPCGIGFPRAPCMEKSQCDKHFPKKFCDRTKIDERGYPTYRRRNDGAFCVKNGAVLDNRHVVPHNVDLLIKYHAHINVEICNQSKAIKYLFKYINKGPDRARAVIEPDRDRAERGVDANGCVVNEIKAYLDCRYLCAYESCWRLFSFDIHFRHPAILRFLVHLRDQQNVYFKTSQSAEAILARPDVRRTMFTEWMAANAKYESARTLLYADFPREFVWHPDRKEIRTVKGVLHPTFQAACEAHGLLGDDKEWHAAMDESSYAASAYELRELFTLLIVFCQVSHPTNFFEQHWAMMSDDVEYNLRGAMPDPNLPIPSNEIHNRVLSLIGDILLCYGTSLADKNLHVPPSTGGIFEDDKLIFEELSYNCDELESEHAGLVYALNPQQRSIYEPILASVEGGAGQMFFVHGHGGTGKTFLWKTVLAAVRLRGSIALAVASSGIASLLLPGGRTAHSRFKIPLNIDRWSTCEIRRGTQVARLMQQTKLIVWDEAPMMNRHCIEALDRSLRDICGASQPALMQLPFGGITVVFGGDLRQILPVISGGSRGDIVDSTICNSPLWSHCRNMHLTVNMRVLTSNSDNLDHGCLASFARWLINVGDGNLPASPDYDDPEGDWIEIPTDLLIKYSGPRFIDCYAEPSYLRQRAIITPFNNVVDQINECMLDLMLGPPSDYFSHDSVSVPSGLTSGQLSSYPIEFLNTITSPGVPAHRLRLKVGAVVMLLRNVNQMSGLCNGTRLIINVLGVNVIQAEIISGDHISRFTRNIVYNEVLSCISSYFEL
ncbi:DNA helicase PIF1, ATP-dependent [Corchorus olitorius]|uniref:ATP-dependent DNA helicase n=1 Tax=Corchorus olitorius TaxID=93759 RepID=A0A1R3H4N8_9ROSI|nr:DNA helicase PIF1, ATP-dependent [Corchorus olitorius]